MRPSRSEEAARAGMLRRASGLYLPYSARGSVEAQDTAGDPRGRSLIRWGPRLSRRWAERMGSMPVIQGAGDVQYRSYVKPNGYTMNAAQTQITGTSEALLWPYTWTAMTAQFLDVGEMIQIHATGIMTTAASSPGTLTINPRWGTSTSGTTLGISNTSTTLATSLSNVAWVLDFIAVMRAVSLSATSSTATGAGHFHCQSIGSATAPGTMVLGGTVATVDTVSAEALVFGAVMGSASDTMTTELVCFELIN